MTIVPGRPLGGGLAFDTVQSIPGDSTGTSKCAREHVHSRGLASMHPESSKQSAKARLISRLPTRFRLRQAQLQLGPPNSSGVTIYCSIRYSGPSERMG
jgi:hypothetical protein